MYNQIAEKQLKLEECIYEEIICNAVGDPDGRFRVCRLRCERRGSRCNTGSCGCSRRTRRWTHLYGETDRRCPGRRYSGCLWLLRGRISGSCLRKVPGSVWYWSAVSAPVYRWSSVQGWRRKWHSFRWRLVRRHHWPLQRLCSGRPAGGIWGWKRFPPAGWGLPWQGWLLVRYLQGHPGLYGQQGWTESSEYCCSSGLGWSDQAWIWRLGVAVQL